MEDFESYYHFLPKRNRSCFVYGCFSTAANKKSNLGFHKFPERGKRNILVTKKNGDKCIYDRRQVWIDALNIGREAAQAIDGVNVYICSLHFARDDFYYNQDITGRRYLKEHAIPRRNLPVRKTSALTTKFIVRPLHRRRCRGYSSLHNPDGRILTAPRRFLGAGTTNSQSYTKTVWVVRKPKTQDDSNIGQNRGPPVLQRMFLPGTSQNQNEQKRKGEGGREKNTILRTESGQQNNLCFDSEVIIKDEPSDYEMVSQGVAEGGLQEDIDVEEEPDKLVIQAEDNDDDELQVLEQADETEENSTVEDIVTDMGYYNEDTNEDFEESELLLDDFDGNGTNEHEEANEEFNEEDNAEFNEEDNEGFNEEDNEGFNEEDAILAEDEPPKDEYFVCLICSEMFSSQHKLAMHSIVHQNLTDDEQQLFVERTINLTCEFCGRVLSTKATLKEHMMIHTGEKPNECMLCGKSFRHKANLVVHVNSHAVVSTYKCRKCNKAFTKKSDFENHLEVHKDASGNLLVCKICNAVFKSQRTLYNHSQLHTTKGYVRQRKRKMEPTDPTFTCRTCGKVLSTKATLKEHEMIHTGERPHICNICGRAIRHKANFVVHVQTHGQGKSYECDMCDEAFMRKSDLTQHKQQMHAKSKLLRCPICSEVFKSPHKFNRHMEIHESVTYMNETEELICLEDDEEEELPGFEPHLLEEYLHS